MRVGVLGIGKTPHKIQHSKSLRDLIVEAGRGALADAGVSPSDIGRSADIAMTPEYTGGYECRVKESYRSRRLTPSSSKPT